MVNPDGADKELQAEEPMTPNLPEDFYRSLLDLPSCIVNSCCDNCGRCEH